MKDLRALMTIDLPEGELGGLRVERFEVTQEDMGIRARMSGRTTKPGMYTRLMDGGRLWMSDTDAEKRDHLEPLHVIEQRRAERILINGLGLGMVLKGVLSFDHVQHIDVVEKDERVIKLIGPRYTADARVHLHHADAYEQTKRWPSGTKWDVGWSDIWGDYSVDDLSDMAKLNRSYGRRCNWHKCWQQDELKCRAERERKQNRVYAGFFA